MTFERNPILEEKLLLLRARKYANSLASLDGVDAVSVSLLKEDDFLWHRQEMRKTYAIDREIEGIVYPLPVNADDLIQQITGLLDLSDQFSCYFFYEGACIITINGNSFRKFLMSFFEMQQTYDLGLIFINPDRILTVDDGEYDLFIYHNCAVPMNDDVLHTDGKDRHYSPFIRGISILVNTVGMAFYLGLSYVSLSSSTSMGGAWVSLTMWGLAPLIVTTYCLWYLKKADENVMGLFIVTPVVILIHYFVMGIAAHTGFWGVILSLIELAAAIAFVVIARRKGYVRHQPSTQSMTTKNHLQDTLAL